MGNSVFRYFQEWLRVQLREEAYDCRVRDAEAAAARVAMAAVATAGDVVPPRGPFWRGRAWVRQNLPGGFSGNELEQDIFNDAVNKDRKESSDHIISETNNLASDNTQSHNAYSQENSDESTNSKREYPHLWELAKEEGDRDFIDWLGKHIWTYVGLAAPLLGAPGPLRSVLSGENMGLPFTDEEAREMELCKFNVDYFQFISNGESNSKM